MQIRKERHAGMLTLHLEGRLETATAPKFQTVVEQELEAIEELVIDLSHLEYVSSAGLRVLLAAYKKMKENGGIMTVKHANEDVMEVFEITGFREILDIQ